MEKMTFSPMKFGSEEDFKIAINELKWINHTKGKLTKEDFEKVSEKYCFPDDFLKHGIVGLVFPDDYRISKSKWYPIIYSWSVQENEQSNRLYRLQIDYISTKHSYIFTLTGALGGSELLAAFLWNYFDLGIVNLALLAVSFLLFIAALAFEMRNNLADKKQALQEFRYQLREKGFEKVIESNDRTIRESYKHFASAGKIMQKKLEEGIVMTIFKYRIENGTLIVEDSEFPFEEYKKRLELDLKSGSS